MVYKFDHVTSFNFKEMLFSLLSDPELMQEENLLLDPTDPCSLPEESDFLDEINTGSVYRTAHGTCCTKPNDLLCGIIIYVDKTVMGPWTKNTLEPVQFTLAIFNKEARKSHKFWRPLGYIPDLFNRRRVSDVLDEVHGDTIPEGSKHLSPLEKIRNLHLCLERIFSSLVDAQEEVNGLPYDLVIGGKVWKVNLKVPLLLNIGDCEGNDYLCGRYNSHNGTKRLCRDCDCPTLEADNVDFRCKPTKMSVISKLLWRLVTMTV